MAQAQQVKDLCIATWNVHNWYDGKAVPNLDRILNALQKTPVDIIGFEEAMLETETGSNALDLIKQKLAFNQLSSDNMQHRFYHGVVLASKYEIIETFQVSHRLQFTIVHYKHYIIMNYLQCMNTRERNGASTAAA